jgi:hypothetical protein
LRPNNTGSLICEIAANVVGVKINWDSALSDSRGELVCEVTADVACVDVARKYWPQALAASLPLRIYVSCIFLLRPVYSVYEVFDASSSNI